MKKAKGWRQIQKEGLLVYDGKATKEELYKYLEEVFFGYRERKEARMECTSFVNEDGVEMIQVLSPNGILQTTAENWQKHMEEVGKPYITLESSHYKSNPITSTKVTLDHGIEVTITYDLKDEI
jgi:hypothetical protein